MCFRARRAIPAHGRAGARSVRRSRRVPRVRHQGSERPRRGHAVEGRARSGGRSRQSARVRRTAVEGQDRDLARTVRHQGTGGVERGVGRSRSALRAGDQGRARGRDEGRRAGEVEDHARATPRTRVRRIRRSGARTGRQRRRSADRQGAPNRAVAHLRHRVEGRDLQPLRATGAGAGDGRPEPGGSHAGVRAPASARHG